MIKDYILSHWSEYDIVNTKDQMVKLLNILEAHGESLDSLHDVSFGNTDRVCEILFNSNPETDREVAKTIFEYNQFFKTEKDLYDVLNEDAETSDMTLEELSEMEDIRKTSDGYVRVLHY